MIFSVVAAHAAERTATMRITTTVTRGQITNQPYQGEYYANAQVFTLKSDFMKLHAADRLEISPKDISSIDSVDADFSRDTSIMSITVKCADSRLAAEFANAIMDAYIDYINLAAPVAPPVIDTLTAQAQALHEKMKQAEEEGNTIEASHLATLYSVINNRIEDRKGGIDYYDSNIDILERAKP